LKSIPCLIAALLLAVPAAEAAPTVAPHRAVYDLSLMRASPSLQSASGRLAFEIEGSTCEGFTVSFRMATRYRPKEGEMTLIDTSTTTYEGPGALDFRHQITERVDGALRDDHRVKMTRATAEAAGEASISSKPGEAFTVSAGTLLPMQHQLRLMALGRGGGRARFERHLRRLGRGQVLPGHHLRGQGETGGKPAARCRKPRRGAAQGPVRMADVGELFRARGQCRNPEYQVSFDLFENGVATGLVLDYGEFALAGKLADLKMLEAAECP
jgi:hypothetical protein